MQDCRGAFACLHDYTFRTCGDGCVCVREMIALAGVYSLFSRPCFFPPSCSSMIVMQVRVAMVTGDHPLTAEAIARKVCPADGSAIDDACLA